MHHRARQPLGLLDSDGARSLAAPAACSPRPARGGAVFLQQGASLLNLSQRISTIGSQLARSSNAPASSPPTAAASSSPTAAASHAARRGKPGEGSARGGGRPSTADEPTPSTPPVTPQQPRRGLLDSAKAPSLRERLSARGRRRGPPPHRRADETGGRRDRTDGRSETVADACDGQASAGWLTLPSNPCPRDIAGGRQGTLVCVTVAPVLLRSLGGRCPRRGSAPLRPRRQPTTASRTRRQGDAGRGTDEANASRCHSPW